MFSPSVRHFSIAGNPSGVPGILIIAFGRSSAANSRFAASIDACVSFAIVGETSSDAYPSPPSVSS